MGPNWTRRVLLCDQILELLTGRSSCRGDGRSSNKTIAPININMRFLAERRRCNHRHGRAGNGPCRLHSASSGRPRLCARLCWVCPHVNLGCALTRLDRFLLSVCVPLLGRRNQAGINNLSGDGPDMGQIWARYGPDMGMQPFFVQLPIKRLHHALERSGLSQFIAR